MNQESLDQSHGQLSGPQSGEASGGQAGRGSNFPGNVPGEAKTASRNEAVLGPFTVRDLTVFASTLVLFVASLIPMFGDHYNLWNLGSLFFLGLGIVLPLIVAALFAARRLAPETKVRIGSLSIDQFGSVVASFTVAFFFLAAAGAFVPSMLLGVLGSLGLLAATVLARHITYLAGDFLDRAELPAHVVARESAVPTRKPQAPKAAKPLQRQAAVHANSTAAPGPYTAAWQTTSSAAVAPATGIADVVPAASVPAASAPEAYAAPEASADPDAYTAPATAVHAQVRSQEPIGATVDPASRPEESDEQPVYEAFWFAVAQHRTIVDPRTGAPVFSIEPGGWVLALEDRGHEFLVQHTDGGVGVLRDLGGIERG